MKFSLIALTFASLAAAQTDGNFPYLATARITGVAHVLQFSSMAESLHSSLALQPAWTSFIDECRTTTPSLPTAASQMLHSLDCEPYSLAISATDATTTPTWVTQLPSDMQKYLSTIDLSVQSIAQQVNGDGGLSSVFSPLQGQRVNGAGGFIVNIEAALISVAMGVLAWL